MITSIIRSIRTYDKMFLLVLTTANANVLDNVVALGMKVGCLKSVTICLTEQLELLATRISQFDEVALHLVALNRLILVTDNHPAVSK